MINILLNCTENIVLNLYASVFDNRVDVNDEKITITAAQQSQAAVLAVDSAVEKDSAVTKQKHFPLDLNIPGFVVFSVSCPICMYVVTYLVSRCVTECLCI